MISSGQQAGPAVYQFRVEGHLGPHWSPTFSDLTVTHHDDGTTTLVGLVVDQAALHGLLAKIRDLGLPLVSVGVVDSSDVDDPHAHGRRS